MAGGADETPEKAPPKKRAPRKVPAAKAKAQVKAGQRSVLRLDNPAPAGTSTQVPLGTLINNNYRIDELLNAGGMGEVFRGVNVFSGDAVAVKIVLQSLAHDEKVATLFRREARVLCQLSDQAIVRYYNFVHDPGLDRFCLIMEFIDGTHLSDHVRKAGPLSLAEGQRLLRRLALALERAHGMEVIHRDLSPDNVMLRGGRVDEAVLIDFGIAKSAEMKDNTLFGQMAGKFKYVSPEQLGHFGGEIGPRTDVYSLALLMAAALRGEPLGMGASVVEAVNARREIPDLTGVPVEMRPLLAHMLEPDPAMRPARMSDVIRLLDRPAEIPARYGAVAMPSGAAERTVIAPLPPTLPPGGMPQGGIGQTVGQPEPGFDGIGVRTNAPVSLTGTGLRQPPGAGGVSVPPVIRLSEAAEPVPEVRQRGWWPVWGLLVVAVLAGGGFYAMQGGFGGQEAPAPPAEPDAQAGEAPEGNTAETLPPPDPSTREGFLAGFGEGPCLYAARVAAGPDTGMIEGFAQAGGAFTGLPERYEARFGSRPALRERMVTAAQCAVLDLARGLQGGPSAAPVLTLDTSDVRPGGAIVGQVRERRGRPLWLVLITPAGGVHDLSAHLSDQPDGSATFSFSLATGAVAGQGSHLILALASEEPLVAASAARSGIAAADLLPLVLSEVQARGGAAGAALSWFRQVP